MYRTNRPRHSNIGFSQIVLWTVVLLVSLVALGLDWDESLHKHSDQDVATQTVCTEYQFVESHGYTNIYELCIISLYSDSKATAKSVPRRQKLFKMV